MPKQIVDRDTGAVIFMPTAEELKEKELKEKVINLEAQVKDLDERLKYMEVLIQCLITNQ